MLNIPMSPKLMKNVDFAEKKYVGIFEKRYAVEIYNKEFDREFRELERAPKDMRGSREQNIVDAVSIAEARVLAYMQGTEKIWETKKKFVLSKKEKALRDAREKVAKTGYALTDDATDAKIISIVEKNINLAADCFLKAVMEHPAWSEIQSPKMLGLIGLVSFKSSRNNYFAAAREAYNIKFRVEKGIVYYTEIALNKSLVYAKTPFDGGSGSWGEEIENGNDQRGKGWFYRYRPGWGRSGLGVMIGPDKSKISTRPGSWSFTQQKPMGWRIKPYGILEDSVNTARKQIASLLFENMRGRARMVG